MFNFIPVEYYAFVFFNVIFIFVIINFLHTIYYNINTKSSYIYNHLLGILLFLFILFFMGLRPISWVFGDMGTYAKKFDQLVIGNEYLPNSDILFYSYMNFISFFESKTLFFFSISFFYLGSVYVASKRLFGKYYYFSFLIIICSFEFWSYGTNGIRNGLATSIFILALTFINRKWIMYILFLVSFSIHSSILIPILAYFIVELVKSKKIFYFIWLISIALSITIGNVIENFIISLNIIPPEVVNVYFNSKTLYADSFSSTGFRWDFLMYSSIPVISSYYFLIIKKFDDLFYSIITNIYLLSNSIWILVIEASFSNRFAYLSWFMMALVILYPLLKQIFWRNQYEKIGLIILIYYMFTYFMNFIFLII